jgi:hypothetical protein
LDLVVFSSDFVSAAQQADGSAADDAAADGVLRLRACCALRRGSARAALTRVDRGALKT